MSNPVHNALSTGQPVSALQSAVRERLHASIPGGAHTYAKGDDQYPANAPTAIVRGEGCRVWDVEGNEFIEYGAGVRAVTLGHASRVVEAVAAELVNGTNFVRPSVLEAECAEQLIGLIEAAEMVKFTKDGSSATTATVKLARAFTGRDKVALCAEHPFFSYDDWFFATTPISAGIPRGVAELSLTFPYNDLASIERLFVDNPGEIAAVILEPEKNEPPTDGYLPGLRDLCNREGAVLVFDEMITGFRWNNGGAQAEYDVAPDLSTFGKGLANGFAVSALVGKRDLMELGGLRHDRERVFLLSTTHGAETHSLAASMATMSIYEEEDVVGRLHEAGRRLREGSKPPHARPESPITSGFSDAIAISCTRRATRKEARRPSIGRSSFKNSFGEECSHHRSSSRTRTTTRRSTRR